MGSAMRGSTFGLTTTGPVLMPGVLDCATFVPDPRSVRLPRAARVPGLALLRVGVEGPFLRVTARAALGLGFLAIALPPTWMSCASRASVQRADHDGRDRRGRKGTRVYRTRVVDVNENDRISAVTSFRRGARSEVRRAA